MKKNFTLKICLALIFLMFIGIIMSQSSMAATSNTPTPTNETAKVTGKYNYQYAKQVLDLVNQERAKVGAPALKMSEELFKAAQQRAAETAVKFSHTRTDGTSCFTADSTMMAENIAAGQRTPAGVMNSWMNSSGHKANILNASMRTIGIGCFEEDGIIYWVQCFGLTGTEKNAYPANETKTVAVPVTAGSVTYKLTSVDSVTKGNEIELLVRGEYTKTDAFVNGKLSFDCANQNFTWASKDTKIATVVNGKVKGIAVGKTTITATIGNKTMNCELTVAPKLEKIELDGPINGEIKVETGANMPLYVVYLPEETLEKPAVTWTSSNTEIATVVDGMVTTLKPGKVTITAKTGNYVATKEITVIAKPITETGSNNGTNAGTSTGNGAQSAGTNSQGQGTATKTDSKTASTTKTTKSAILPMGDNTVIIYAGAMIISLAGIAYIVTRKIRKNK